MAWRRPNSPCSSHHLDESRLKCSISDAWIEDRGPVDDVLASSCTLDVEANDFDGDQLPVVALRKEEPGLSRCITLSQGSSTTHLHREQGANACVLASRTIRCDNRVEFSMAE